MAYKCLVITLPSEASVYARFTNPRYDIESKNGVVSNVLNTNSDGAITYSISKIDGSSADGIASIDAIGKVTIIDGAMGHLVVTANIEATEEYESISASYLIDVYKLYKAGEELDVEKQDFNGYNVSFYSPYWRLSNYNASQNSVRAYKIPKSLWKKDSGWVIHGAIETFQDSSMEVLKATNFEPRTTSLGGDILPDGNEVLVLNLISLQAEGFGNRYTNFASSGSDNGKFVRYPADKYKDMDFKWMYFSAPNPVFAETGIFLTVNEDFKDYGDVE